MPDLFDTAQMLEEKIREHELQQRKETLPATGRCHNCRGKIAPRQLFCDSDCDCDTDHQLRHRAHAMRKRVD